jgi:LacI family transcriptional regulator
MGLHVPKKLSVAGVDDSVIAQIVWPQLTTCHRPIGKMADAAVSILLLEGQEQRPSSLHLEHKLIVRGSTAPPSS